MSGGRRYLSLLLGFVAVVLGLVARLRSASSLLPTVSGGPEYEEPRIRQVVLLYAMIAGALAVACASWPLFRIEARPQRRTVDVGLVGAGAVFIALFVWITGNHQFGGYDLSSLIDLAWRLSIGQRPYGDFICTVPIGYALAVGASFSLLGASWDSIVIAAAVVGVLSFTCNFVLVRRLSGSATVGALVSFTLVSDSVLVVGHPFHGLLAAVVGQTLVLSALCFARDPEPLFVRATLGVSVGLMLLMKPNTAALLLAGVGIALLSSSTRRARTVAIFAWGGCLAAGILAAARVDPRDVLKSYLAVRDRALPDKLLIDLDQWKSLGVVALLGVALLPGILSVRSWAEAGPSLKVVERICGSALLAGMYAMMTNWDLKLGDLTLVVIALTAHPLLAGVANTRARAASVCALFVLCAVGLTYGVCRTWSRESGYGAFFEWTTAPGRVASPFFPHLRAGPRMHRVVREAASIVHAPRKGPVFFGPRMEFLYAALKIPSPRGLPIWWHPGSSYPITRTEEIVARWKSAEFGLLVFLKDDFTRVPDGIVAAIAEDYREVSGQSDLSVFVRRLPEERKRR